MAGGPHLTRSEYNAGRSLTSLEMGVPRSLRFLQGRMGSPITAFAAKIPHYFPMLLTVRIEAGRSTLTHTSWTVTFGSRKWMSGQSAALATMQDRRPFTNSTAAHSLREPSLPSARRPPSPLDFYLSWVSLRLSPHFSPGFYRQAWVKRYSANPSNRITIANHGKSVSFITPAAIPNKTSTGEPGSTFPIKPSE
jgi:hypothetical protein